MDLSPWKKKCRDRFGVSIRKQLIAHQNYTYDIFSRSKGRMLIKEAVAETPVAKPAQAKVAASTTRTLEKEPPRVEYAGTTRLLVALFLRP